MAPPPAPVSSSSTSPSSSSSPLGLVRWASQRSFSSNHQVLVKNGTLLNGRDLRDYALRQGLCRVCATVKTHERVGRLWHKTWRPLTTIDPEGNYTVYKGFCLQPTCYTLNAARERLGEVPITSTAMNDSNHNQKNKSRLRQRRHRRRGGGRHEQPHSRPSTQLTSQPSSLLPVLRDSSSEEEYQITFTSQKEDSTKDEHEHLFRNTHNNNNSDEDCPQPNSGTTGSRTTSHAPGTIDSTNNHTDNQEDIKHSCQVMETQPTTTTAASRDHPMEMIMENSEKDDDFDRDEEEMIVMNLTETTTAAAVVEDGDDIPVGEEHVDTVLVQPDDDIDTTPIISNAKKTRSERDPPNHLNGGEETTIHEANNDAPPLARLMSTATSGEALVGWSENGVTTHELILLARLDEAMHQQDMGRIFLILSQAGRHRHVIQQALQAIRTNNIQWDETKGDHDSHPNQESLTFVNRDKWSEVLWFDVLEPHQWDRTITLQVLATIFHIGSRSNQKVQHAFPCIHHDRILPLLLSISNLHETDTDIQNAVCILLASITAWMDSRVLEVCEHDLLTYLIRQWEAMIFTNINTTVDEARATISPLPKAMTAAPTHQESIITVRVCIIQALLHLATTSNHVFTALSSADEVIIASEPVWELLHDHYELLNDNQMYAVLSILSIIPQPVEQSHSSPIFKLSRQPTTHVRLLIKIVRQRQEQQQQQQQQQTASPSFLLAVDSSSLLVMKATVALLSRVVTNWGSEATTTTTIRSPTVVVDSELLRTTLRTVCTLIQSYKDGLQQHRQVSNDGMCRDFVYYAFCVLRESLRHLVRVDKKMKNINDDTDSKQKQKYEIMNLLATVTGDLLDSERATAVAMEALSFLMDWSIATDYGNDEQLLESIWTSGCGPVIVRSFQTRTCFADTKAKLSTLITFGKLLRFVTPTSLHSIDLEPRRIMKTVIREARREMNNDVLLLLMDIAKQLEPSSQEDSIAYMLFVTHLLDLAMEKGLYSPIVFFQLTALASDHIRNIPFDGTVDQIHTEFHQAYEDEESMCLSYSTRELVLTFVLITRTYRHHKATLIPCCQALLELSVAITSSNNRVKKNLRDILLINIFPLALDALTQYPGDEEIQEHASHLLSVLFCHYCSCHETRKTWGLRLLSSCRLGKDNGKTIAPVYRYLVACDVAMTLLLLGQSERLCFDTINDSVEFLVSMLRHPDFRVAIPASETLAIKTHDNLEVSHTFVQIEGVVASMLSCLERNKTKHGIVQVRRNLFRTMSSRGALQDFDFQYEIANFGGLQAIVIGIEAHIHNELLIESACEALLVALNLATDESLQSEREHIASLIPEALRAHHKHLSTQNMLLDVARSLCSKDVYFRRCFALSIVPDLVTAMCHHFMDPLFLASGCAILRMLAHFDDEEALRRTSAADVIMTAIVAHTSCSTLLKEGLVTLTTLATSPATRCCMIDSKKIVASVVNLMEYRIDNPDIIAEVFALLNNVLVDTTQMTVAPVADPTVLDFVLDAMQRFPENLLLQENASLLLKTYTYESGNFERLQGVKNALVPILLDVCRNHTGEAQERARFVMRVL